MAAGTINVADNAVTTAFVAATDGGKATVYMVNPVDGDVLVGIPGMPGHGTDPATTPVFPVAAGTREYFDISQMADGNSFGGITAVYLKSASGTISVRHGAVAARR